MTASHSTAHEPATRRGFVRLVACSMALGGAATAAWPLIDQMNPSADLVQPARIDISKVPPGNQLVVLWRGQPIFIRHRTAAEIASAEADDDNAELRFPARDADRVKPQFADWIVLVGRCTWDTCTPTKGEGDFGGWGCPCCGSQYDLSGRARKGPASFPGPVERYPNRGRGNLVVPPYDFPDTEAVRLL